MAKGKYKKCGVCSRGAGATICSFCINESEFLGSCNFCIRRKNNPKTDETCRKCCNGIKDGFEINEEGRKIIEEGN